MRQDGEPVIRMTLLLTDPPGDTWPLDEIRELRWAAGRKAAELGLPEVSISHIARSEPEAVDFFGR